jgi:hypothetical protein
MSPSIFKEILFYILMLYSTIILPRRRRRSGHMLVRQWEKKRSAHKEVLGKPKRKTLFEKT